MLQMTGVTVSGNLGMIVKPLYGEDNFESGNLNVSGQVFSNISKPGIMLREAVGSSSKKSPRTVHRLARAKGAPGSRYEY